MVPNENHKQATAKKKNKTLLPHAPTSRLHHAEIAFASNGGRGAAKSNQTRRP